MRKIRQAFTAHARTNRETAVAKVAKVALPKEVATTTSKKKLTRKKKVLDNVCENVPNPESFLACEEVMPHVPVENQILPQLERGPQIILPETEIVPETNNEERHNL
jgi:hypothetical protein